MPKIDEARKIYNECLEKCVTMAKRAGAGGPDEWRKHPDAWAANYSLKEMEKQIEAERYDRAQLQRVVSGCKVSNVDYVRCFESVERWPDGVDEPQRPRVDEAFFVPRIERVRVRVLLFQDRTHVVGGASVVIDDAAAVATDANGLTDLRTLTAGGRHRIRVTVPPLHAGVYVECQCGACRAGTPRRYLPRSDAEYPIAPLVGADQTIDVYVDQLVRLRLGQERNSVPAPNTVDCSWLTFYLPETQGARADQGSGFYSGLAMETNLGSLDYFGTNPRGAAASRGDTLGCVLGPRAAGWHFARVIGGGAGPAAVSVILAEMAYARESNAYDAAPLIPWKFYFWPTGTGVNTTSEEPAAGQVVFSPLWAFDVHSGQDPTTADSAFGWESDPVNAHHDTEGEWSGHCNQAATASIIFKEPPDGVDWHWTDADREDRQLQLDSEGLKILATEFAGHRVKVETLFTIFENMMPEFSRVVQARVKAMLDSGDARYYPSADGLHLFKENGTEITAKEELERVKDGAGRKKPMQVEEVGRDFKYTTWEDYKKVRDAWDKVSAARLIKDLNAVNVNGLRRRFPERGTYATRIFAAMQAEIGVAGQPLLTDVRASATGGSAASNQVWNQAIYLYRALYSEHPEAPKEDTEERRAQDMQVLLTVFWNEDYGPPTYGAGSETATVTAADKGIFEVIPRETDKRDMSLSRNMRLRLQFSNGGRLNPADDRNDIETCTGRNDSPFFLLRYLQKITAVTAKTVSTDGNPFVDDSIFDLEKPAGTKVLQLRDRYPIR
ncbi:MAG TPA: hypothetical protein VGK48_02185 [Terriglobia bacterium]|jgi:hypothetical protein